MALDAEPFEGDGWGRLPGTRFAVIVDEAHSSQSGEMTKSLKQVLTSSSLEEAEREDELEMDIEDQLVAEMKSRGPQKNVSTFALRATPRETMIVTRSRLHAIRYQRALERYRSNTREPEAP